MFVYVRIEKEGYKSMTLKLQKEPKVFPILIAICCGSSIVPLVSLFWSYGPKSNYNYKLYPSEQIDESTYASSDENSEFINENISIVKVGEVSEYSCYLDGEYLENKMQAVVPGKHALTIKDGETVMLEMIVNVEPRSVLNIEEVM